MADYIKREHRDDSGIVYCLSRKVRLGSTRSLHSLLDLLTFPRCFARQDAEDVAAGLKQQGVRTGVYHADVDDGEKQQLHRRWREGSVKVVVATIACVLSFCSPGARAALRRED